MNITNISSIIKDYICANETVELLRIQNHIYGCLIIAEDIVSKKINCINNVIVAPKYESNIDKYFSYIGLRYGFLLDTKLILRSYPMTYKVAWLEIFKTLAKSHDVNVLDELEEAIIDVVITHISKDDNFFIAALDSGSLPQEHFSAILHIIQSIPCQETLMNINDQSLNAMTANEMIAKEMTTKEMTTKEMTAKEEDTDDETTGCALSKAITEKVHKIKNPYANTRKHSMNTISRGKYLGATRRARHN